MALKTSKVYRCLEKKTLILGFEILDLLLISTIMAALHLLLGDVKFKFFLTFGPSLLFALLIRLGKAGKPDNYLLHLIRFHTTPSIVSAFPLSSGRIRFLNSNKKGAKP